MLRALTIQQPYAALIVLGEKLCENREHDRIRHKGRLLIHAGKSKAWLHTYLGLMPSRLVYGAILGDVEVEGSARVGVVQGKPYMGAEQRKKWPWLQAHKHCFGPHVLVFNPNSIRRLAIPVPYTGRQGLFCVPDEVLEGAEWIPVKPQY